MVKFSDTNTLFLYLFHAKEYLLGNVSSDARRTPVPHFYHRVLNHLNFSSNQSPNNGTLASHLGTSDVVETGRLFYLHTFDGFFSLSPITGLNESPLLGYVLGPGALMSPIKLFLYAINSGLLFPSPPLDPDRALKQMFLIFFSSS